MSGITNKMAAVADGCSAEQFAEPDAAALLELVQQKMNWAIPTALDALMPLASAIPPFSGNILEVHFNKGEDRVDFATRINKQSDAALIPGRLPFTSYPLEGLMAEEYGVENLWLEYDAPFTLPPALFFDVYRNAAFSPQNVYTCLQQIAGHLGYPLTTPLLPFMEQVQQLGLQVVYYGLMFSRQTSSIRLTIHGITVEMLAIRLKQLGWRGNYDALQRLQCNYLHAQQQLVVGVDLGTHIGNRIGIEVFDKDPGVFIHKLYNNGWISAGDKALFEAWPGCQLLPENMSGMLTYLQQRQANRLYTRINHFKFVVDDTDTTTVKGYLYYCY